MNDIIIKYRSHTKKISFKQLGFKNLSSLSRVIYCEKKIGSFKLEYKSMDMLFCQLAYFTFINSAFFSFLNTYDIIYMNEGKIG